MVEFDEEFRMNAEKFHSCSIERSYEFAEDMWN